MHSRNIIINSTILFCMATLWHQTLHESGHFLMALLLGSKNIALYHNYVTHDTASLHNKILIAAAGPVLSLISGILFQFFCSIYSKRNTLFLFFLYMSVFGYINFGGYLMISPFFKNGDTGFVFNSLGFSFIVLLLAAVFGIIFTFFTMKNLSKYFVEMASAEIIANPAKRKAFVRALVRLPLFIGIPITTLLNLPVTTFLSLLYPMSSPFSLMWAYPQMLGKKYPVLNSGKPFDKLEEIQPRVIIFFVVTVVINRLLVIGLHV